MALAKALNSRLGASFTCSREQILRMLTLMAADKPGSKRARSTKVNGVTPLSASEFKVIRALHPGFVTMMRQLDADLQREHRMSHAEFVALMFLSEASDRTLGLSELARRCQQSRRRQP